MRRDTASLADCAVISSSGSGSVESPLQAATTNSSTSRTTHLRIFRQPSGGQYLPAGGRGAETESHPKPDQVGQANRLLHPPPGVGHRSFPGEGPERCGPGRDVPEEWPEEHLLVGPHATDEKMEQPANPHRHE